MKVPSLEGGSRRALVLGRELALPSALGSVTSSARLKVLGWALRSAADSAQLSALKSGSS